MDAVKWPAEQGGKVVIRFLRQGGGYRKKGCNNVWDDMWETICTKKKKIYVKQFSFKQNVIINFEFFFFFSFAALTRNKLFGYS